VRRWERVYFAAVGLLAFWVGLWGYFAPGRVEKALPFSVPPLHARFLGAMYLSGLTLMLASMVSSEWSLIKVVPTMTAIWTGGLLIISLLHLDVFDFSRKQTRVWFAAYIVYPLIAIYLAYKHRAVGSAGGGEPPHLWARRYLAGQGVALSGLAAALMLFPRGMATIWPWPITPLLAQVYAAPFLAYGIGSLLLSRAATWREVRVGAVGLLVFASGVLVASAIHHRLFSRSEASGLIWFTLLTAATLALGWLSVLSFTRSEAVQA
jgi:hypothetical protein